MNTGLKNITRGGQTYLHSIRMASQVLRVLILIAGISWVVCYGSIFYLKTTPYERYLVKNWLVAKSYHFINLDKPLLLKDIRGNDVKVSSIDYLHSEASNISEKSLASAFTIANIISGIMLVLAFFWLKRRGNQLEKTELIAGTYLSTPKVLRKAIKTSGKVSKLKIADVPLFAGAEKQHFLVHGSTGTGKSVAIRSLLDTIKKRGDKAIIYDKHGGFIQYYYEPQDIVLNPLDNRCVPWDIWSECRDASDYDSLATALIPMPAATSSDPFWINAARTIFASATRQLATDKNHSIKGLLKYLLTADIDKLSELLQGTEASSLVSEKAAKTALSVKSVLATYLKSLRYIRNAKKPFSIRDWVADDEANNWLFITSRSDKHESLKPLISAWLDIAANSLMSLPEDSNRRVWLIIDELPSLQRLPYLPEAFAESRKFGGCLVAGMQSYFQLQKIYGADGAKEIIDLCNTRLFFRSPSDDAAKWVSREIGDSELLEVREGISYGANTMRDGVSMSHQRVIKPAVSASDIKRLPDLNAVLTTPPLKVKRKKSKTWPAAKVLFNWFDRKTLASPFELIEGVEPNILDTLILKYSSYQIAETTGAIMEVDQKPTIQPQEHHELQDVGITTSLLPKEISKDSKDNDYIEF